MPVVGTTTTTMDNTEPTTKKKQKKETAAAEKPLLPKEEIEKRLERAKKFGTGDAKETDDLKAMLRAHRFNAASAAAPAATTTTTH
jgi:hypothetical protein